MRENATNEALRRQTIRMRGIVTVGTGCCPGCQQRAEVFARRRSSPGPTKECCLDCWKMERQAQGR